MNLPKSWHSVKLYQFKELRQLKNADGFFNVQLETLAILADVSSDELDDYTIEDVATLFKSVKWVLNEPEKGAFNELLIDGETFYLQPFKKLTLDEFIDLEYFLQNDYLVHISHIVSVFWRRMDRDKWHNVEFEPYIFSPFDRNELFDDIEITKVYGILNQYLKYRENFMQKFAALFNSDDINDEEPINPKDFDSINEYKDELKYQEQNKKAKKWGWESLIYDLCEGDFTKIKAVGELPLILVFNMLAMRKELGYLEPSKG